MPYPFATIWINHRIVLVRDIMEAKTSVNSEFEAETFTFIRDWLSGEETFRLHTSGSTGAPKAIEITRAMMIASASATQQALGLQLGYNALVCLNTKFIAGKMMLVRCLETGMQIFAVEPCANPLAKIPVDKTIHFAALVPYQVKTVLESKHPHLLDGLLTCIIGGAPIDEGLAENIQKSTCHFYLTYGMTETVSHIALRKINGVNRSELFEILPGVTICTDERNCLVIQAQYFKDEVATNDVVEIVDNNHFKWLGRFDNIINTGGIKISSEVLEEKISQIFKTLHISNRFFVYGLPDPTLHQKIILIIEGDVTPLQVSQIENHLLHSFSSYEKPKEIFQSRHFVFTETAKINRSETIKSIHPVRMN